MVKVLQARLQQHMNQELPNEQLGLEKAKEADTKLSTSVGSLNKVIPEKHLV